MKPNINKLNQSALLTSLAILPVLLLWASSCVSSNTSDELREHIAQWKDGGQYEREQALRWFANEISPGMSREEVERRLGDGVHGSDESVIYYSPPSTVRLVVSYGGNQSGTITLVALLATNGEVVLIKRAKTPAPSS